MKKLVQLASLSAFLFLVTSTGRAQVLNPTVSGDNMLCPEGTGTVSTQLFQGYQWYRRYFGSSDSFIIPGETSQDLVMDAYNYAASYLKVEVTDGVVTEMSPEFFVDGWAFLPPTVMTTGDFHINQNGETILCEGDTLYFELLTPYEVDIVWTNNGTPIPNQTSNVLEVTTAGNYHVSGAPAVCPDYNQNLGVMLGVTVENCSSAGMDEKNITGTLVFPNPATHQVTVQHPVHSIVRVDIHDEIGRFIKSVNVHQTVAQIAVDELHGGTYFMTVHYPSGTEIKPIFIQD